MLAIDMDNKTHIGSVQKFTTGWSLKAMVLHKMDVRDLAAMPDDQLVRTVRQLAARTQRIHEMDLTEIEKRMLAHYGDQLSDVYDIPKGGTISGRFTATGENHITERKKP